MEDVCRNCKWFSAYRDFSGKGDCSKNDSIFGMVYANGNCTMWEAKEDEKCCGSCRMFYNEDTDGVGECRVVVGAVECGYFCDKWQPKEDEPLKLKHGCNTCVDRLNGNGLCNSECKEYPPADVNIKTKEDKEDDHVRLDLVPIGLTPAFTVYEPRLQAIEEAIERYVEAGKDIPFEWLKEKSNLIKYFIKEEER